MLTNCLAECAHLTITVSEIERDIGRKTSIFHTPLHSTPPLGGSRRNIATLFNVEKLKMVWLHYGEIIFEDMFIRFHMIYERDRQTGRPTQTDRRADTA